MQVEPPVIFEGGPLSFNKTLVRVFRQKLNLKDEEVIIPKRPQIIIAEGAALSISKLYANKESQYDEKFLLELLDKSKIYEQSDEQDKLVFFKDEASKEDFFKRHGNSDDKYEVFLQKDAENLFLGIDAGSTTSKFVLINENDELIYKFYNNNEGDPLKIVQSALLDMYEQSKKEGIPLNIKALGTTGYGEMLFAKAFKADHHSVKTVAHATSALNRDKNVSFILDIRGQDMKAIFLSKGIITQIILNEACSAGCGSFIETFAQSMNVKASEISSLAFESKNPSVLGSRCTVFMNSSVINEQKNGKSVEDIMAGLSRSVIENTFTKHHFGTNGVQIQSTSENISMIL